MLLICPYVSGASCVGCIIAHPICNTIFQTNLFIVNLAFSDLCMMTTQALPVSINAFVEDVWMYGPLMCRVYACIGGIFGMKSSF